ncbi:MAG: hypothetical protein IPN17_27750 [Deltaproteobacteria bacterium]|nr:hypothetical protein [Deltaproteobacteria bacterium]
MKAPPAVERGRGGSAGKRSAAGRSADRIVGEGAWREQPSDAPSSVRERPIVRIGSLYEPLPVGRRAR